MSKNFDAVSRRAGRAAVVVGFCAAAVLFSITYFASTIPSDAAICERTCAEDGKRGELAYKYTKEQTAGMRGRGPTECRCRQ